MLALFIAPRTLLAGLCVLAIVLSTAGYLGLSRAQAQPRALDVPYVPTAPHIVDQMLRLAKPGRDDVLVDLGCGDGRILVTAAERFGTRGFGVDLNPARIKEARENAAKAKVADRIEFIEGDLFKTDFRKATILTLYLLPQVNLRLRPLILDMKPGTRVVSHDFNMEDWVPDVAERTDYKAVYLWIVPAKVGGTWRIDAGGEAIEIKLSQKFQEFTGFATLANRTNSQSASGRLRGDQVEFQIAMPDGATRRFEGIVQDGRMTGKGWSATRH